MRTFIIRTVLLLTLVGAVAQAGERQADMTSTGVSTTTACVAVPYGPFTFWCTEDVYYALCENASCTVTAARSIKWAKDGARDTSSTSGGNYFCAVQVSASGTCVVAPFRVK